MLRMVLTVMLVFVCTGAVLAQSTAQTDPQVEIIKNLQYRTGNGLTDYEKERCQCDLYLPKPRKRQCPVIVWFHGGGMTGGNKSSGADLGRRFAQAGVIVASVEYRLYPKAKYPDFIDDVAAGTAWVFGHIGEYGGDTKSIFIAGHSAGGYLTGILGMDAKYLAKYGISTSQLAGMIPVSGQAFTHFVIRDQHGVKDVNTTTVCDEAAPCYHVRKDAPPILIIMGDHDWPARAEENRYFLAMLKLVGHPDADFKQFEGRNHGTIIGEVSKSDDPVFRTMLEFVEKHKAK